MELIFNRTKIGKFQLRAVRNESKLTNEFEIIIVWNGHFDRVYRLIAISDEKSFRVLESVDLLLLPAINISSRFLLSHGRKDHSFVEMTYVGLFSILNIRILILLLRMQKEYGNKRWQENEIGWDVGFVSTPLKEYFDQLTNKNLKILIPGCGNAYEAEYLLKLGFTNIYIVEISKIAVDSFLKRCPEFPSDQIFINDFFLLTDQFDLIIEQTFLCAIDPKRRNEYAKKSFELLKHGGKLVGLLFNREFEGGPPFGGSTAEYIKTFSPHFEIIKMETAYNSISARKGTELFIRLLKRNSI